MEILYPENYKEEVKTEKVKDNSAVETFIKELVTKPIYTSDIVKLVNDEYVKSANEAFCLTNAEILALVDKINLEWREKEVAEEVK